MCDNEEIISYLDALINNKKYSWWYPKPKINCDIDSLDPSQKFKSDNGIHANINTLSDKELSELKERFVMNDDTNSLNNVIKEDTLGHDTVNLLTEKIADINIQINDTPFGIPTNNLRILRAQLEEQLKTAKAGNYRYVGGKRKSKRRKNKKPTKKGKKNRKSNKKSMKKSIKK